MTLAANTEPTRGVYLPEELIVTDDEGIIQLSSQMEKSVAQAEQDYEQGKCLSDDTLKQLFAI